VPFVVFPAVVVLLSAIKENAVSQEGHGVNMDGVDKFRVNGFTKASRSKFAIPRIASNVGIFDCP